MLTSLFDYGLPEERIAQHPPPERDASRLLILGAEGVEHDRVQRFPELVPAGSLVVLNDTRVIPARIRGHRPETGGAVEILLIRRTSPPGSEETWIAIGRANRALRVGSIVHSDDLAIEVVEEGAELTVKVRGEPTVEAALGRTGHVPLPPYVRRPDTAEDAVRYQTVFARAPGAVAAPTAGLHLTARSIERLRERDVRIGFVTLHVGLGTFRPVTVPDLDLHPMHTEEYTVSPELAEEVRQARARGAKVVCVGTTVVRALESARDPGNPAFVRPGTAETRLLIQPGYDFGPVDALLTNFHAPRSTLLALVCAFAGRQRILSAYAAALAEGYRFLSYGDAMWIPERAE